MGCPQKRGAELAGPSPNHRYRLLHYLGAALPSNFKVPLRDGDAECGEKGGEYAGHWFLNASSTRRPQIVDINRNDIWEESDVYSGCYARVCINLFPFSQRGNRRICCGLETVQKICDGEALGGVPVDVNEAFGDWNEGPAPAPGYSQPVQGQGYPQQGGQSPV